MKKRYKRLSRPAFPLPPRLLREAMQVPMGPCLLCLALPSVVRVIFRTNAPEHWGGKAGTLYSASYFLCQRCFDLPDKEARADVRLQANVVGRWN